LLAGVALFFVRSFENRPFGFFSLDPRLMDAAKGEGFIVQPGLDMLYAE